LHYQKPKRTANTYDLTQGGENRNYSKKWKVNNMASTVLAKAVSYLGNLLVYKPPDTPTRFVLKEIEPGAEEEPSILSKSTDELENLLRLARRLEITIEQARELLRRDPSPDKIKAVQKEIKSLETQKTELAPILLAYNSDEELKEKRVSASLAENILLINKIFQIPQNKDLVIREIIIPMKPPLKAALVFSKSLIDKKEINSTVLTPLFNARNIEALSGDVLQILSTQILPINQLKQVQYFPAIIQGIQAGDTALFVDGSAGGIVIETKGFEHRAISTPRIEQTIRGNQSAFTETLLTNISLVRLALRSPDLVTDISTVGARSRIGCAVMYVQSVANPALVAEVKRRINGISADDIAPGMLMQFIEDHPRIPFPQALSTERPDRVSSHLAEGRIAILLDGDPNVLVVPVTLFTLFHSPEDYALKLPSGTFMRVLRFIAALLATILPSLYLAISYYHPEAWPTDLALAIAGAREQIPFPAIVEIFVMELSFEFIREAGTRKPGILGETIGIVGGIILGQAVVAANLVSPITVVIIAITGVASFAIPDFQTGMAVRLIRFLFLMAAMMIGLVGVASGFFILTLVLCYMKSFGVPYMSPIASKTDSGLDAVIRGPVFRQEDRPDFLNTLDPKRQPSISRKWLKQKPEGGGWPDEF
jgi:spore germination protein KA